MAYGDNNYDNSYKSSFNTEREPNNNNNNGYQNNGYKKPWNGEKKQWNNKPKVDNSKIDLISGRLEKFFSIFIDTMKQNNMVLDETLVKAFNESITGKVRGFCVALPNIEDNNLLEKVKHHVDKALQKGYTFRHLNISYVEKMLDASLEKKKAYIPWAGYNDSKATPITDKKAAEAYFLEKQPGWEEWKPFLKAIYMASYAMLMGEDKEGKVAFVLTYNANNSGNSPETRDMTRVLKLARDLQIPIYDLNDVFEIPE